MLMPVLKIIPWSDGQLQTLLKRQGENHKISVVATWPLSILFILLCVDPPWVATCAANQGLARAFTGKMHSRSILAGMMTKSLIYACLALHSGLLCLFPEHENSFFSPLCMKFFLFLSKVRCYFSMRRKVAKKAIVHSWGQRGVLLLTQQSLLILSLHESTNELNAWLTMAAHF